MTDLEVRLAALERELEALKQQVHDLANAENLRGLKQQQAQRKEKKDDR